MSPGLEIIVLVVMLIGLLGLIVPIFPGSVVIWLAALGYGIVDGFGILGGWMFGLTTVLMLVSVVIDNVLMSLVSHKEGASWVSIVLALVAGIVGTIAFPPVGGIIAAPLVLWLSEYIRLRDAKTALTTVRGLVVGWGLSYFVRLIIGLAMIGLWGLWVWGK